MFEENKPTPETPEVPPTPETPPVETPPVETPPEGGAPDQTTKIVELKGQIAEKDTLLGKQDKEIKQQRYTLGKKDKLIQKAKEEGFETDDVPESGSSKEEVSEIVTEALKPLQETIETMGNTMSEMARANQNKPNPNPDGSGQNPPPTPKEPELTSFIKEQVKRLGLKWTGKGRIYKSPKTDRTYDYDSDPTDRTT